MTLSSNSLFHFTRTIDNLKSILENGFSISYCKEIFHLADHTFTAGIPMVSFCDIPLKLTDNHTHKYGKFGIGLTKEWGTKNYLNPVSYMQPYSSLSSMILPFLHNVLKNDKYGNIRVKFELTGSAKKAILRYIDYDERIRNIAATVSLISFMKNYEGYTERNPTVLERFYDEREWRYVPNQYEKEQNNIYFHEIIDEEEYRDWRGDPKKPKPSLNHRKLNFDFGDIEYVIVDNKKSKGEILELLKVNTARFGSGDALLEFATRILTIESLKKDF